jgi:2'-5' RNA ligase
MASVLQDLKQTGADVKWERSEKLHTTVKFLGETDPSLMPAITSVIRRECALHPRFQAKYKGLGSFPTTERPRVLWIGLEDPRGSLSRLQKSIDAATTPLGFKPEDRPFHPHVTLGRVRSPYGAKDLLAKLQSLTFESEPVMFTEIVLVTSELTPGGSVYRSLERFPLGEHQAPGDSHEVSGASGTR